MQFSIKALIGALAALAAVNGAAISLPADEAPEPSESLEARKIVTIPVPLPIGFSKSTSTFTTYSSLPSGVKNTCPPIKTVTDLKKTTITVHGTPPPGVKNGQTRTHDLNARGDGIKTLGTVSFPLSTSISVSCPSQTVVTAHNTLVETLYLVSQQ